MLETALEAVAVTVIIVVPASVPELLLIDKLTVGALTVVVTAVAVLLVSSLSTILLLTSTVAVPLVRVPALLGVTFKVRVALLFPLMLPPVNLATPPVVPA
ncbi:hypothetical protein QT989_32000 [Microcoleus sp. SVA1_B6]